MRLGFGDSHRWSEEFRHEKCNAMWLGGYWRQESWEIDTSSLWNVETFWKLKKILTRSRNSDGVRYPWQGPSPILHNIIKSRGSYSLGVFAGRIFTGVLPLKPKQRIFWQTATSTLWFFRSGERIISIWSSYQSCLSHYLSRVKTDNSTRYSRHDSWWSDLPIFAMV